MLKYMIKRILFIIPSVLIVSILTFTVLSLSPGTPGQAALGVNATPEQIEAFNHSVGYDRPCPATSHPILPSHYPREVCQETRWHR